MCVYMMSRIPGEKEKKERKEEKRRKKRNMEGKET